MTANKTLFNKRLFALAALGAVLLAFGQRPGLAADLVVGTPVQTIYTKFGDPAIDPATNPDWFNNIPINYDSPDGSDIVYLGTNPSTMPTPGVTYRNTLLVCDAEVDEMSTANWAQLSSPPGFSGFNLFEMDLFGTLFNTFSTTNSARTGWSNEPVGGSFNPNNGHLFISDDDQRLVFEINPGPDGELFTADDTRTSFSTSPFKNNDPEGLAYNPVDGALYIANGSDSEIHKLTPGVNGVFDGVPPLGDDVATHFDTHSLGVEDPEGIVFDADNRLYIVGKPQTRIAHIYTTGPLIRMVDTSAFNFPAGPRKPAGLAVGPTGTIFIATRGADNNAEPNENDGKVHEISVPDLGTPPPAVAAGPDLTVFIPNSAQLNGAAVNAGSTTWSQVSGPGTATIVDPNAIVTTVGFTTDGIYVLRLSDNSSSAFDEITVQVRHPNDSFGTIYISPLLATKVPINPDDPSSLTMSVGNEDIIAFDTVTRTWSNIFEGDEVGLGATGVNMDAFKVMADGSILLSLDVPVTLPITDPGVGTVVDTLIDDSDIVRFVPTALGDHTAGSFEWYFDGSDVGLDTDSEDIDGIGFLPSGKLFVSLSGSGSVPGVSTVQDEDLIAFTASDLGVDTVGTWTMHFDGSDAGLADGGDGEDVMGAWIDSNNIANPDSSNIYLTTKGAFSVPGASGDGADIFRCTPSSIGTTTACNYTFNWDGGAQGIAVGVAIDGIDLAPSLAGSDATSPTVSITAPVSGSTVSGTATTVSADANDDVGIIGVQFKLDGANLGAEDTAAPYDIAWNTTTVNGGGHTLTAVARDAAGNVGTDNVTVTVNNGTSGAGGLTHQWKFDETSGTTALDSAGPNNATLTNALWVAGNTGNAASFNGTNAYGTAGTINFGTGNFTVAHWVKVAAFKNFAGLFNNRSSAAGNLGFQTRTDGTSTFTALIDFGATTKSLAITNAVPGTWYHVAVSVDRAGLMKLYVNGAQAGQVDIAAFSTTSITIPDTVRIGRDQASVYFNGVMDDLRLYDSALSATDIQSLATGANPPADTTPPTVSLTAPTAGATVSGPTTTVSANATDNVGVAGVQFKLDGVNLGTEDITAPYAIAWNTTTVANGAHSLTAVARDAAGNSTTSSSVSVTVNNVSGDTTPPTVSLTAPAAGATVSGTATTVSATAADNVGVAGVQFKLDGANLGAEDTTAPFSISWNTTTVANGSHSLTALARDAAGNMTTSSSVSVTVNNVSGDTTPPTVSITVPAAGATVSGTTTPVSADASDDIGVVGVQFKLDGVNLGAEDTTSPYSISWNTTTATAGAHSLTALARDAAGNTTTSSAVSVTVNNGTSGAGGLTHQWQFDETSGTTALDSAGPNNATLSNALWVAGNTGNAASFNGTNAYGTAGTINFGTGNFTVAHWVKVAAFKNFAGLFNNRTSASGNLGFQTRTDGTSTFTALIDFGATSKNVAITNAVAGTWYHVAVSVDRAGLMKLYVNGVQSGQVDISAFSTTSITIPDTVRIGRDHASVYFNGVIDELRLYNSALSAEEILNLYNN